MRKQLTLYSATLYGADPVDRKIMESILITTRDTLNATACELCTGVNFNIVILSSEVKY